MIHKLLFAFGSCIIGRSGAALVEYSLTITDKFVDVTSADGNNISRYGSLVNDQLPGPILRAKEGDQFLIYVTNNQTSRNAALHWHGLTQPGTPYYDGVPGVSECGISSGSTAVYNFTASPVGTYWYHSHEGVEYPKGQYGALVVDPADDAEKPEWEQNVEEEFILLLSEWNYTSPEEELQRLKTEGMGGGGMGETRGLQSMNDMGGMGDMGETQGTGGTNETQDIGSTGETPDMGGMNETQDMGGTQDIGSTGETQDMGGMNETQDMGGTQDMGSMSLEEEPDQADVPWPYFLMNGNASVDFNIDSSVSDKWYRFRLICATDNWNVNISLGGPYSPVLVMLDAGQYLEPSPVDTWECAIGARYDFLLNASLMEPGRYPIRVSDGLGKFLATPAFVVVDHGETLFDEPPNGTVTQNVSYPPPLKDVYLPEPTAAEEINVTIGPMVMPYSWSINNISAVFPTVPAYQSGGEFGMDKPFSIVRVATNEVADVLLINQNNMAHPFHIHGHTFWVLGVTANKDTGFADLNTANPVARDTVNVPGGGMVKIRIHFNNPGPWLFHCHIDFHMLEGMAMMWFVGEPEVDWPLQDVPASICGDAEDYAAYPWSRQFIPGNDASDAPTSDSFLRYDVRRFFAGLSIALVFIVLI